MMSTFLLKERSEDVDVTGVCAESAIRQRMFR
jgi:hypothetical protein